MVCKFLNFKFTISTSFIQNVLNYYDKDRVRACREAQIKQGDDGPLLIKPDIDYIFFIWPDGVIYYRIQYVNKATRVILERALEHWNLKIQSPKFQLDQTNRPDSVVFRLGDQNGCLYGYKIDENYIEIKKDCRGEQGIYMIDILHLMGRKAGLWPE